MKKFYAILCLAIASLTQLEAQAPQGFNYQATVRNSSGDLIVNTNVYFKFNVIQGSQTAVPIFTETHYVPTDDLGQVNLVIGQGTANTGIFSELDWSLGSYYLGIELDTGSGYVAMGTTQLLSVPYALYAESAGDSSGFPTGGTEGQVLGIVNGVPAWTDISESVNSESLPEIITVGATNIDFESMISGGNITSDGGFTITSKGVVWSESPDPTIELVTKTDEGGGASNFTSMVINLDEETEYFYRAFATNSAGTSYGSSYTFVTSCLQNCDQDQDGFTVGEGDCDDNDPNEYPSQIWYIDADSDGYASDINETSCLRPINGFLLSELSGLGDCDDSNATVYLSASEIEDEVDNDCDGDIDENDNISELEGTYAVSEMFTDDPNGYGLADYWGEYYQIELSAIDGDSNTFKMLVKNSDNYNTYYVEETIFSFYLNGHVAVDDGIYPGGYYENGAVLANSYQHYIFSTNYDVSTGTIVISGELSGYGSYETVLTKLGQ